MGEQYSIAIYDPHFSPGENRYHILLDSCSLSCEVLDFRDRSKKFDFYIICDQLANTNFPYFFPKSQRAALLKESPIHFFDFDFDISEVEKKFDFIFSHNSDYLERFRKITRVDFSTNFVQKDPEWAVVSDKSELVSFIGNVTRSSTSEYIFRYEVGQYLLSQPNVDCYGHGIRSVQYKTEALSDYCFSVAMENYKKDYYFSEKLIDCILSETIPIYYGCEAVREIFNDNGILFFDSIEELGQILDSLSVELYESKIHAIKENKKILLDKKLDSYEGFLNRVLTHIVKVRGIGKPNILGSNKYAAGFRQYSEKFVRMIK